jgi:hypothetical protein
VGRQPRQHVFHPHARLGQPQRVVRHDELEVPGQEHGLDFEGRLRNLRLGIDVSGGLRVQEALPEQGLPLNSPIDRPSSPFVVASLAAVSRMVARLASPFEGLGSASRGLVFWFDAVFMT